MDFNSAATSMLTYLAFKRTHCINREDKCKHQCAYCWSDICNKLDKSYLSIGPSEIYEPRP